MDDSVSLEDIKERRTLIDLLSHPAGYGIQMAGLVDIRVLESRKIAVCEYFDNDTNMSDYKEEIFDNTKDAVNKFLEIRYRRQLGLDFDDNMSLTKKASPYNINEEIKQTEEKLDELKKIRDYKKRKLKKKEKEKRFKLRYHLEVTLAEHQIWPDGDGPLNPTKDDVLDAIWNYKPHTFENRFTRSHPALIILDEWFLIDDDQDILKIIEIKK